MKTVFTYLMLLLAVTLFSGYNTSAQDLPNGGMEEWTPSGQPAPFDWEEPTGWKSNNSAVEFISAAVAKSTQAYEGVYSCFIKTIPMFGSYIPGMLVNGEPNVILMDYTIDILSGGTPVTYRPDYLTGYYKFDDPEVPDDSAFVLVILKKYNFLLAKIDTVGLGSMKLPIVSTYTQFTVNVDYISAEDPDSIIVAFMSSNPDTIGSKGLLYIDDISLSPSAGINNTSNPDKVRVYQSYNSRMISIENNSGKLITLVSLYNSLGQVVFTSSYLLPGITCINLNVPEGVYFYQINSTSDNLVQKGKLIIRK